MSYQKIQQIFIRCKYEYTISIVYATVVLQKNEDLMLFWYISLEFQIHLAAQVLAV